MNIEEKLYNFWEKGGKTPQYLEELVEKLLENQSFIEGIAIRLFKNENFLKLSKEFVQEEIVSDFQERNENP